MAMETIYRMFSLERAEKIAMEVYARLQPGCQVIGIAGSIRRRKPEVKDIELVCVPKMQKIGSVDLFGNDNRKEVISDYFLSTIHSLGSVLKGSPHGRMMQILLPEQIVLDLFIPQPYDFWRQFIIRTGSANYSHKIIATGWLKKGWCGTRDGLRLQTECDAVVQSDGKTKWTVKATIASPTLPPVWENEKQFFDWLGVQYLAPEGRNM